MSRQAVERFGRKYWAVMIAVVAAALMLSALPVLGRDANEAPPAAPAAQADASDSVTLRVEPAIAALPEERDGGGLWFLVSGLEPGQEFALMTTMMGVDSMISSMMDQEAVASDEGAAALSWEVRPRFASMFDSRSTVSVVDSDTLEVLATAPVIFCDPAAEEDSWCAAADPLLPR
ncbi:MAG: hypothetical protein WD533_02480 [Dehalococcoidia bacterium]